MPDIHAKIARLRRPGLLIRAARHGLVDYDRDRALRRLLGRSPHQTGRMLETLVQVEESHEDRRRQGDAGYSFARHIEVLVALMAEARLTRSRSAESVGL